MNALVLDAGALAAIDRDDRTMLDKVRVATENGQEVRTNAMALAQVWRDNRWPSLAITFTRATCETCAGCVKRRETGPR